MSGSSTSSQVAWPALAALALLGGCQPPSVYDCSAYDEHKHLASGRMEATIGGQRLASWRSSVQSVADRDLYMSACVVEDGKETWRFSAKFTFDGPVTSTPVTVAVPSQNAPGLFGGFLDVANNREHHFLLDGAGTVTVTRYDPAARAFDASGVVYPKQGGEVPLAFALTWAARELGPRPK
ncbi:MAG TPA: hypothetical protein VK447_17235 [Myxococcaceae bacterium]|nr:hypothetical protein [Myxococcaceae bacterium]